MQFLNKIFFLAYTKLNFWIKYEKSSLFVMSPPQKNEKLNYIFL